MTAAACASRSATRAATSSWRALRLVERRVGPLLLVQRGLPLRLGGADHLGGVRVDDVQEAHRRQHVAGVAAGEQQA